MKGIFSAVESSAIHREFDSFYQEKGGRKMDLLEVMRTRRSIRSYKQESLQEEDIMKIIEAGLLSESGKAIRPWDFVVVKNKETLQKMAGCRAGSVKMLKEADCAIVVLGNGDATDVWIEDCSVAMANMHLMAHSLGLGSCWVQGRLRVAEDGRTTEEYVRDILNYPENYKLQAILTIGVPNEEKEAYNLEKLPMEKVHQESF